MLLTDDASPSPHVRRMLEEYAARDARIKVTFRESMVGIVAATNDAFARCIW